jgi:uncharacterized protein YceH (UPF0502 family)
MDIESPSNAESSTGPRWRPIDAQQRRVLGVLIEKAKTTPENYPLSLNALKSGCNQKSNRSPYMQLEDPQIEEALEELRRLGAVMQVQGGGRVDRYRHLAYEWLGAEKVEMAVMAELILRGAQTVGELRGRAARMEPIKDLGELAPTLDALEAKGLIAYLTPRGRGSIVTHTLYLDREMEKVRRESASFEPMPAVEQQSSPALRPAANRSSDDADPESLAAQIGSLQDELASLKRELAVARDEFAATTDAIRRELDELNQQLGN